MLERHGYRNTRFPRKTIDSAAVPWFITNKPGGSVHRRRLIDESRDCYRTSLTKTCALSGAASMPVSRARIGRHRQSRPSMSAHRRRTKSKGGNAWSKRWHRWHGSSPGARHLEQNRQASCHPDLQGTIRSYRTTIWCRGPDSNRQANEGGGFSSHCFFRSRRRAALPFVRWTMPSPSPASGASARATLGAPRLVSTPSRLRSRGIRAWLGVASARRAPGVSPNLKGSAPAVSDRALNHLSPLCLPISSPRQKGGPHSTTGAPRLQSGGDKCLRIASEGFAFGFASACVNGIFDFFTRNRFPSAAVNLTSSIRHMRCR